MIKAEEVDVIKSGETIFQALFSRSKHGITMRAKVHPSVEDFFSTLAHQGTEDPRGYGRYWIPMEGQKFSCWMFSPSADTIQEMERKGYSLTMLGQPFALGGGEQQYGRDLINLSFIRLVGISQEDGQTLSIKETCTADELTRLAERVQQAARLFYVDFLRPKNINIVVATQEK
jgi:hypothetical protein